MSALKVTLSTREKLHCESFSLWCRLLYCTMKVFTSNLRHSSIRHKSWWHWSPQPLTSHMHPALRSELSASHLVLISFITWWTCTSSRLSKDSKHLPLPIHLCLHTRSDGDECLSRNEREKMLFLNSWDFNVSKHWPLIYLFKWVLSLDKKHALAHNSIPKAPIRRFKEA